MKILRQQQGGRSGVQLLQPLEHGHGLATPHAVSVGWPADPVDEIPGDQLPVQPLNSLVE